MKSQGQKSSLREQAEVSGTGRKVEGALRFILRHPSPFSFYPSWILWLLVAAATLAACRDRHEASDEEDSAASSAVAKVTLTHVEQGTISDLATVTGTVFALPNQDVRVSSLVAGRIARVMVADGDRVGAGEVLAKIEEQPYRDQLQQAEASVEQAKANVENARLSARRNEDLFQRGIAARKDVEDARTTLSVAQAALQQAEAQRSLARLQISRCQVRSPLSGLVVKRFVSDGEQVDGTAAQPIAEVANLDQVELYGNLPALYLGRMHAGEVLPVATEAFPGKILEGRIVAISPAVDPATNMGMARIRISNPGRLLRLGMFLTAQLAVETHSRALLVPNQSVYRNDQGQPRVYRVQGNQAEAIPVRLGLETKEQTEILSGLRGGETVILSGGYGLGDHARVKVEP